MSSPRESADSRALPVRSDSTPVSVAAPLRLGMPEPSATTASAAGRGDSLRRSVSTFVKSLLPAADLLMVPLVYPAALLLKLVRSAGVHRMPLCRQAFLRVGVFPVRDHYFEPLFNGGSLQQPLDRERPLPGIDWNLPEQLDLLDSFDYNEELRDLPTARSAGLAFHLNNGSFEAGDAEFLYNLIRLKKPSRVFEIGSGNSTLMALRAIRKNRDEFPLYRCRHLCIEPYEQPWLERTGVTVFRERLEDVDPALFAELEENDLLFIDSSHVIRPQGDVLFEYLELLPRLNRGVIVHVHDIFSPRDYPREWIVDEVRLWNEQYLLEAFLTGNSDWKIIGALNYLHHNHNELLRDKSPHLSADCEPGSFYIQKVR